MKSLKHIIPNLFEEQEINRVDYYIEQIKQSLIGTNKLFITYSSILVFSIIMHHLYINQYILDISIFGVQLSHTLFIKRWFLVLPSALITLLSLVGYLRVYQMECLEWLLAKYRNKEYSSEIFRLTLPASHILGMNLLRRQENKWIRLFSNISSYLLVFLSLGFPVTYIEVSYLDLLKSTHCDIQILISFIISNILILSSILFISFSQRI